MTRDNRDITREDGDRLPVRRPPLPVKRLHAPTAGSQMPVAARENLAGMVPGTGDDTQEEDE